MHNAASANAAMPVAEATNLRFFFLYIWADNKAGLALKNLPNKTHQKKNNKTLPQVFFLIFYFLRYLKAFYINYINSNSITKHISW